MNEQLKELSLQAGGGHYPTINPQLQEAFAHLIIKECITAVYNTDRAHAYTTFDKDQIDSTIERSVASIIKHFDLPNAYNKPHQPYKNLASK